MCVCMCVCMCVLKYSDLTRIHLPKPFSLLKQIPEGFGHSTQHFFWGSLSGTSKHLTYVLKRTRAKQLHTVWELSQSRMCPLWTLGPASKGTNSWGSVDETWPSSSSPFQIISITWVEFHQFLSTVEEMGLGDS